MLNAMKSRSTGKTFLHIFFFLLLIAKLNYSQWYQQNSGTTETLTAITFLDLDPLIGYCVGWEGVILKTSDGGNNWSEQISGSIGMLNSVYFTDVNNGWIVGTSDTINIMMHTTNGGQSWINQSNPTPTFGLYDVYFIDVNNGWAVGSSGVILRTTNGGDEWLQQTSNTDQILNGIYFFDMNLGTIVGDRYYILNTTNGGQNWIIQLSGSLFSLYSVVYTDSINGWAVGDFEIFRTTNGGMDWVEQLMGAPYSLKGVCFTDTSTGTAVGYEVILRTTNGGIAWTEQAGVPTNRWLRDVFFIDKNEGWAVGDSGLILHTTTGGVFVEEEQIDEIPTEFLLSQNYPNPFNPSTSIQYAISSRQFVSLKVYDVLGNEIETLVNSEKPAGTYEVTWYAEQLPSGVYFYQFKSGDIIQTKKMILLK